MKEKKKRYRKLPMDTDPVVVRLIHHVLSKVVTSVRDQGIVMPTARAKSIARTVINKGTQKGWGSKREPILRRDSARSRGMLVITGEEAFTPGYDVDIEDI